MRHTRSITVNILARGVGKLGKVLDGSGAKLLPVDSLLGSHLVALVLGIRVADRDVPVRLGLPLVSGFCCVHGLSAGLVTGFAGNSCKFFVVQFVLRNHARG